jgi:hypothetical protein
MKKTLTTLTIIGLTVITVASAYAEQKNLTGNWTMRVNDEISLRLVLTQEGKNITGTLQNPHGNPIQIKGQFSGKEFQFTGSSEGGEWAYRLSGKGTLQPDGSFAGDIKSNVGDMKWTAVRAEAK